MFGMCLGHGREDRHHRRDDDRRHRSREGRRHREHRRHRPTSHHSGHREQERPRCGHHLTHYANLPVRSLPPDVPRPATAPPAQQRHQQQQQQPQENPATRATYHQPDDNNTLTAVEHSASDASEPGGAEGEDAECLVCTKVARRRARLACGHMWCRRCLRTQVRNALGGGDAAWPPRCCAGEGEGATSGEITEETVRWLGDGAVLEAYGRRRAEAGIPAGERVYCHLITCAALIPPAQHHRYSAGAAAGGDRHGGGGRVAVCQRAGCGRMTCVDCGTAAHRDRRCPRDPDLEAVLQTIEAHGYQFCARCNAVVERSGGCNHITCRCGYQFCYMCGERWKRCGCEGYGGPRIPRWDRPRLEEAVRGHINAPVPPTGAPHPQPALAPNLRHAVPAPADDEERQRDEHDDDDAVRRQGLQREELGPEVDNQMQLWEVEDIDATPPPTPSPDRTRGPAEAAAPAPAAVPGLVPADAASRTFGEAAPARRTPVERLGMRVRDGDLEPYDYTRGRLNPGEQLPYPEAAYRTLSRETGFRGLQYHMHNPGVWHGAHQLQARARLEEAMWRRAQQEQMMMGPPGYPAGGVTMTGPTVLPGGTVRYQYSFGAQPSWSYGGQGVRDPYGGPGSSRMMMGAVPGPYLPADQAFGGWLPPGMDLRAMMYQAAMGLNRTGQYSTQW